MKLGNTYQNNRELALNLTAMYRTHIVYYGPNPSPDFKNPLWLEEGFTSYENNVKFLISTRLPFGHQKN